MTDFVIATLFVVFASGPSWLAQSALFLEVPYFQQHSPEGLCLATWLSISLNLVAVLVFVYYLIDKYLVAIAIDANLLTMLFLAPIATVTVAFTYEYSFGGISWPLLICSFLTGVLGWMQYQGAYPVLTRYDEKYTIAARSAVDILGVFLGAIVFYQNPGSDVIKFSPFDFLLGVGLYLAFFPPVAYFYIYNTGIGLKGEERRHREDRKNIEDDDPRTALLELESSESKQNTSKSEVDFDIAYLAAAISWLDFNNWGLLPSILPFVFNDNSPSEEQGSVCYSYSLNLVSLMYVIGGLSTYLFHIPIPICIFIFTVSVILLYLSAVAVHWFNNQCWVLVLLTCICNIFTAHVNTSVYNILSCSSDDEDLRAQNIKFVGIATMGAIFVGSVVSLVISNIYFKCF